MMEQSDLQAALNALNQGNHKSALKLARIGMKRHRAAPEFPNIAGIAASSMGKPRDAVGFFQQALKLAPEFHDARRNLTQALILLGQYDSALKLTARLLRALPGNPDTLYLQAQSLLGKADYAEALDCVESALEQTPGQLRLLNLKVRCLTALHRPEQALETLDLILPLSPDPVSTMMDQCRQLCDLQRFDDAHALCKRILELAPDHGDAQYFDALQLAQTGKKAAGLDACQRILAQDPLDIDALVLASSLITPEQAPELLPIFERGFAGQKQPVSRAKAGFALARVIQASGNLEEAIGWYARANALHARATPYDARADQRIFDRIKESSAGLHAASAERREGEVTPIFILGQPRSGTTLLERILEASPEVEGLGELPFLDRLITPKLLVSKATFSDDDLVDLAAGYMERVRRIGPEKGFFTDKMPENYLFAGFVLAALPGSRILHLVRDPRDVALSMWQQDFGDAGLAYPYDMGAMAQRANHYRALMNHWHTRFPGRILDVAYQDLVTDLEATSRRICDYCGLDWVPDMLSPEKSSKTVKTASITSVFGKVNTASLGKWEAHAETLAPLIKGLDPALWPELDL